MRSIDISGYKSFGKGIAQLREEGAVQVFYPWGTPRTEPILGAVGELQFEVAKYRLESEYNVKTILHTLPYSLARHVEGDRDGIARAQLPSNAKLVEDWSGRGHGALRERVERPAGAKNGIRSFASCRSAAREDDEALAS